MLSRGESVAEGDARRSVDATLTLRMLARERELEDRGMLVARASLWMHRHGGAVGTDGRSQLSW